MSNLLQLKNGRKTFGARTLFDEASFAINVSEKVGVIGPNGAGKTTMFKILVGREELDSGEITLMNGLRLGYLAQEDHWDPTTTVEDYLSGQTETPMWDVKSLAPSFGLQLKDFGRAISSMSGGYRMRAKLLFLLASKPDLMLLDEPTNYLDLETLLVLENFLQNSSSAFLLISHDREFLRRVTDHVLEIEGGEVTKYAGNIDDYFEQKALIQSQLEKAAMTQAAKRKAVLDFAAKFGAKATKARQVQSRLKRLDQMETIELKALPLQAQIRLPTPVKTGKSILRMEDVILGYGDKTILKDVKFELTRGDHLGVVGVNGAGKSTLLKAIAGDLVPLKGEVEFGMNVDISYYAQHVAEKLDDTQTVLEAMYDDAESGVTKQDVLDLAGSLLFRGDDVHKKVRVLSGGEKSRVALGKILLRRASCLVLDEPTNHLDFHTVEALTQALANYEGAVVIVSHDRSFVRRTASRILEINNGRAEFYPGTYDEYVWSVQKGALSGRANASPHDESDPAPASGAPSNTERINFKEKKKQLERDLRAREKEVGQIDRDLALAQAKILTLNESLLKATGESARNVAKDLAQVQTSVDAMEERYLVALEEIEKAQGDLALMENRRAD